MWMVVMVSLRMNEHVSRKILSMVHIRRTKSDTAPFPLKSPVPLVLDALVSQLKIGEKEDRGKM